MTEDEAFLQAILEEPDADAPRLMYADWLDERDDPRAEFIRVQCTLASAVMGAARRAELKQRERALLRQYQDEWIQPLRGLITGWLFRRGFVEVAWLHATKLLQRGAELFSLAPLREIKVRHTAGLLPAVAASPFLARLTALNLAEEGMGDEGVRALAASPYLEQLAALDLGSNNLSDDGVAQLANSSSLRHLLCLRLSLNHIRDNGALALAATPYLGALETLNLYENLIGDRGAVALARSPRMTRLDTLYLGGNPVSAEALQTLQARFGKRLIV